MIQTAFGKDIGFSLRTFRFSDGESLDDQNQTVTCDLHLEPATDVAAEQAADCTCHSEQQCTGIINRDLYIKDFSFIQKA